jgi:protein-tyrosine-phosphatase
MNYERNLDERVARHAALADPTRLQMVDLLNLGDWSPGELKHRLGLPSNLLAHHLNVLENAGLIRRGRSEGDRRRSYVTLHRSTLSDLDAGTTVAAQRVVFVCTGNSARSQLAAALWAQTSPIPAASGGTHPADRVEPGAIAAARRHGLTLGSARPQLLADVAGAGDYLVTVCDNAHEELRADALHWSIPDPVWIGTDAAFDAAFDEIARRIDNLAPRIAAI